MPDYLIKTDGFYFLKADGGRFLISPQSAEDGEILADPVDLITANPDTNNPASFAIEADLAWQQLKTAIPQMNAGFNALRLVATSDTSSSTNTIDAIGDKTFTVSTNKSFLPGQYLIIADTVDPTINSMLCQVKSYSNTALVVTPIYLRGSGTKSAWTISLSAPMQQIITNANMLRITTGNGHGTSAGGGKNVRRYSVIHTNTASGSLLYTDSALLGGSIKCLVAGLYRIRMRYRGTTSFPAAITKNSTNLNTDLDTVPLEKKILIPYTPGSGSTWDGVTIEYLEVNDIIRTQDNNANTTGGSTTGIIDGLADEFLELVRIF